MLEQILNEIHNYFEREIIRGTFTISDGALDVDFLQNNQYFRIVGSVFNDGVHCYPTLMLSDETFEGEIWCMAVPKAVLDLCNRISGWVGKYAGAVEGPYQSESFGGYSYTKKTTQSGSGSYGWRDVFRSELNNWRKIS